MNIEICNRCSGSGQVRGEDDGRGNWEYEPCTKCDSTGRIYTKQYKLEMSFGKDINDFHKIDSEMIKLIRNIKK